MNETKVKETDSPPCGGEEMPRRAFFRRLAYLLGGWAAAMVSIPMLGFIFAPLFEPEALGWQPVGPVDSFKVGETVAVKFLDPSPLPWAGVTAKNAAWLRRLGPDIFIAFSVNCTHLGCPVRWLPDAGLFMCPCHGGVYDTDGRVQAGPPPKPLPRYATRVKGGVVEILARPITIA